MRIFDANGVSSAVHRGVEQYAMACGYHNPVVLRVEEDTLVQDVQYQDTDQLSSQQFAEIAQVGVDLFRGHPPRQQYDEPSSLLHQSAKALAALLKIIAAVENGVLLLGQLIIIKSSNPESLPQTYVKVVSEELKQTLAETPELLDSSQAMVNFLYNRAELPDAIA